MCVGSEVPGGAPRGTSPPGLCCRSLVEAGFPWGADSKAFTPPASSQAPFAVPSPDAAVTVTVGTCWGCRPGEGRTEGSRGKGDLTLGRWWDVVRSGLLHGVRGAGSAPLMRPMR